MLNTIDDQIPVPNFARIEVENGYQWLVKLHSIYKGIIAINTRKGVYNGPPEYPVLKSMLEEYLASTAKRAA